MENEIKVDDAHRVNELSRIEGGATLKILRRDGKILVYDKVKSVRGYSEKMMKNDEVMEIWHENTCIFKRG